MNIQGHAALVTGGGSGLGEATARELARLGAKVAVLDLNLENAQRVAKDIGGMAVQCNVSDPDSMQAAVEAAAAAHGPARILMQIAGIGSAKRVVGKDGNAAPLADFARVINVNLIGTYNAARLFAAACAKLDPMDDGERGVMVFTASVAAFDGQVGQQAYSASKAGVAGMTLPMARDLAQHGIRVCTIAPGLFATPLMKELPEPVQESLAKSIPFPNRLGKPEEFAETGGTHREQTATSTAKSSVLTAPCAWPPAERTHHEQDRCLRGGSDVRRLRSRRHRLLPQLQQVDGRLVAEFLRAVRRAALARAGQDDRDHRHTRCWRSTPSS